MSYRYYLLRNIHTIRYLITVKLFVDRGMFIEMCILLLNRRDEYNVSNDDVPCKKSNRSGVY